jgi:hypothetical protein
MSNVIRFLETLGREPAATPDAYAQAVQALDVDPEIRDALQRRDRAALDRLLGARHNVMIALVPAEDDEPEPREEPGREDEITLSRVGHTGA